MAGSRLTVELYISPCKCMWCRKLLQFCFTLMESIPSIDTFNRPSINTWSILNWYLGWHSIADTPDLIGRLTIVCLLSVHWDVDGVLIEYWPSIHGDVDWVTSWSRCPSSVDQGSIGGLALDCRCLYMKYAWSPDQKSVVTIFRNAKNTLTIIWLWCTVNSCLVDTLLLRTLAITNKIHKGIKIWLEMTPAIIDSRYYSITDTFVVPKWQFYCFDS